MVARVEASVEDAEAAIARGIAGLPHVVSVHCKPDGKYWQLVTSHDYGNGTDAMREITDKVVDIEEGLPHLSLEALVVETEYAPTYAMGGKLIYAR